MRCLMDRISPPQMLDSILRFSLLLDEFRNAMKNISHAGPFSRFRHLHRNESRLGSFKVKLDDAYRDFLTASTLRLEFQQTQLAIQQKQLAMQQTGSDLRLEDISAATTRLLLYSRFMTFFGRPLMLSYTHNHHLRPPTQPCSRGNEPGDTLGPSYFLLLSAYDSMRPAPLMPRHARYCRYLVCVLHAWASAVQAACCHRPKGKAFLSRIYVPI
ncbi:hypothetical protein MSAN_00146200 [Mycena sanguinolenta]|uniref:Uncharacterized protein n=1 Tax=Mycena sanguinolenta TaxID=230812 RepID=A0A8H7DJ31_9AGAR|nr:hypothetical protein MSAN_00146200 [Mycena sanguinolenta]